MPPSAVVSYSALPARPAELLENRCLSALNVAPLPTIGASIGISVASGPKPSAILFFLFLDSRFIGSMAVACGIAFPSSPYPTALVGMSACVVGTYAICETGLNGVFPGVVYRGVAVEHEELVPAEYPEKASVDYRRFRGVELLEAVRAGHVLAWVPWVEHRR